MLENLHGRGGLLSCILGAVQSITSFFKRYMSQFLRAVKEGGRTRIYYQINYQKATVFHIVREGRLDFGIEQTATSEHECRASTPSQGVVT